MMIKILNVVCDFKEDVIEDIKNIFIEKDNIIETNNNESLSEEDDEEKKIYISEKKNVNENEKKSGKLTAYDLYLINGDVLLDEKINL